MPLALLPLRNCCNLKKKKRSCPDHTPLTCEPSPPPSAPPCPAPFRSVVLLSQHLAFLTKVEWFERTFEENEELGLNDMNTAEFETVPEGYEGGASSEGKGESERNPSHLIPHRVGTDHPTPFTKGQEEEDTTKTDGVCAPAADA